MAQPDSQSSAFEASNDSNGLSDLPESPIDGRPVDEEPLSNDKLFQSSVGEMLNSIETDSIEEEAPESSDDDATVAGRQNAAVDPADELLIRAGSILNGGETEIPDTEAADSDQGDDDDDLLFDDDAGDDLFLDSGDGFSISDDDDDLLTGAAQSSAAESNRSQNETGGFAKVSRYVTWTVAAGLAFVGLSILAASFKGPILDFLAHGDIQETRIHRVVAKMTEKVFNSVESGQPYDLAWVESDIKRVSDSEYRVIAKIGARLKEDLFRPLDENYAYTLLPFSKSHLEQATSFVGEKSDLPPELKFPRPGWTRLYKRQGAKGEVFEIDAQYRITANDEKKGSWELSSLRVNGDGGGLNWTSILPKAAFEEGAVDVDAMEFAYYLRAYEKAGMAYLEKAKAYERVWMASRSEKAERLQRLRQDLIMSLSQGSYFRGVAILGEASEETREVSLVVTETRADGELVKGLFKLEGKDAPSKHFTGVLDIVEDEEAVQGHLELTTIAFAGQPHDTPELAFFKPGTVSRIRMNTDGRMLEGDSDAISLRLMRGR